MDKKKAKREEQKQEKEEIIDSIGPSLRPLSMLFITDGWLVGRIQALRSKTRETDLSTPIRGSKLDHIVRPRFFPSSSLSLS
jgi:hypothetical protein